MLEITVEEFLILCTIFNILKSNQEVLKVIQKFYDDEQAQKPTNFGEVLAARLQILKNGQELFKTLGLFPTGKNPFEICQNGEKAEDMYIAVRSYIQSPRLKNAFDTVLKTLNQD